MGTRRSLLLLLTLLPLAATAQDEDFRVYKDPPRIFLNSQRLRRLQRETQRDSLRWRQFSTLADGKAQFTEPGFAWALHYSATGNAESAKAALDWAMLPASNDIRQIAMVYDWCRKTISPAQKTALAAKLQKAISGPASTSLNTLRNQVLAAVALGDDAQQDSEKILKAAVKDVWRGNLTPALRAGKPAIPREDLPAVFEIMHVIQDNFKIDLREDARVFFRDLPTWHLLSHYPAPLQTAENEFRVPVFSGSGDPDLKTAALSRAVELMMVAYDVNAQESQFLQGYLIQDRFLMRGAFGLPYEFLWANPYQPGLPFEKMEPFFHDALAGRFFVRSSWEEDATWFGYFDGKMQLFSNGEVKTVRPDSLQKPVDIGGVTIMMMNKEELRFRLDAEDGAHYFILGVPAKTAFDVEVDEEEVYEAVSDASGILSLDFARPTKGQVWIHRPGRGVSP
jgi:hypothetical protein